ncbi:MFS transporter [Glycomyces arizonensis]|uniref:MFS transporter n=1 Tax=Glycomyces arizonensis TaxID=256035 RepID=UPI0003F881ED|nr:MFS transporter [Glycomyces arizonensis]
MATDTHTIPRDVPAQMPVRIGPGYAPIARTLPVFVFAALLATGQMYTPIPLFTAMESDWNATAAAMTWIVSAFAFGYAGGFVLFGPLADRFGQRRVLVTGMIAAAVVTLLTGLAPSLATAIPLRVAQGLIIGSIPPALTAYITTRMEPRRRGVVLTAVATSFLAATVIGQIASQAVTAFADWRWVFTGSAAAFVLVAFALRRTMLDDRPATGTRLVDGYAAAIGVLRIRTLLPILGAGALAMAAMVGVYTGIELVGVVDGPGPLLALRASALPVMIALPLLAVPLGRLAKPTQIALGVAVATAAMVAAAFTGEHLVALAILLAVLVGGLGVAAPAALQSAGELGGEHRAGASSVAMFSFYVGATVGPPVASAAAHHGFAALAWTLAAMLVVAMGLALWGRRLQS